MSSWTEEDLRGQEDKLTSSEGAYLYQERLRKKIEQKIAELDEQDAGAHVWWNTMLQLLDETDTNF